MSIVPLLPGVLERAGPPPLALIVGTRGWGGRALARHLEDAGWRVRPAATATEALAVGRVIDPDLVVVEAGLPADGALAADAGADPVPPGPALAFARALRSGIVAPATPILLVTADAVPRDLRLAALGAGVWDVVTLPCDPEVLLARCTAWIAGKRSGDLAARAALLEPTHDLYSPRGLLRRALELGGEAGRTGRPLACVRLRAEPPAVAGPRRADAPVPDPPPLPDAALADALCAVRDRHGRAADVFGRLGRTEFAVLAPGTDAAGAERLGARLAGCLDERFARLPGLADLRLLVGARAVYPTGGQWEARDAAALVSGPWAAATAVRASTSWGARARVIG